MTDPSSTSHCDPRSSTSTTGGVALSLPVLPSPAHASIKMGHSRKARWRTAVLILVNVLIIAHIIQWLIHGMTLSPIEPSESAKTIDEGVLNTGFIFFSLAILSTIIFGRFFCGWGCHIVALQDFCGWLMTKMGVRPKPFRSRLLLWIPLGVALYMFVWPTFKRHILTPLIGNEYGRLPNWLGTVPPIDRITQEFLVKDFWSTFAPWYVAIPFFGVVGFAVVYFLGNKGFCTYGCPYGGFFGPADLISPGKIRVTDACEGCGHCTAVCTSNVRVHEEVRDFGMVVNPGCMKCLDCVSVCPNDALYFGFGKPTLLAKPRNPEAAERQRVKKSSLKQYDLSRGQELLALGVFMLFVWGYRSFLNEVPLLMAIGMAGIGTFIVWKLWQILRVPNVRLQNLQLRLKGKLKPAGVVFVLSTLIYIAGAVWGGVVRTYLWRADLAYAKLEESGPTIPQTLAQGFVPQPQHAQAARDAIAYYAKSHSFWADTPTGATGGIGWPYSNEALARLAYMHSLLGDYPQAETYTRRLLDRQKPNDSIVIDLARLMQRRSAPMDSIIEELRTRVTAHPELLQTRIELAESLRSVGKLDEAGKLFEEAIPILEANARTRDLVAPALRDHAYFELRHGSKDKAVALFNESLKRAEDNIDVLIPSAAGLMQSGRSEDAVGILDQAEKAAMKQHNGPSPMSLLNIARGLAAAGKPDRAQEVARAVSKMDQPQAVLESARLLAQLGAVPESITVAERAASLAAKKTERHLGNFYRPEAARTHLAAGAFLMQVGRTDQGAALIEKAPSFVPNDANVLLSGASELLNAGENPRGLKLLERAVAMLPNDAPLQHDLGMAYMLSNRPQDALKAMARAAELDTTSPDFAFRLSQIHQQLGNAAEAERWQAEADKRAKAILGK